MFGFLSFGQLSLVWASASCFTCYTWNHFTSSCMYCTASHQQCSSEGEMLLSRNNLLICNFHSSSTGLPTASAFMGPFSRLHSLLQVLAWQGSYFRNQTNRSRSHRIHAVLMLSETMIPPPNTGSERMRLVISSKKRRKKRIGDSNQRSPIVNRDTQGNVHLHA